MTNIQLKDNQYIKFTWSNDQCVALYVDELEYLDDVTDIEVVTVDPNHHFIVTLTDNEYDEEVATGRFNSIDDAELFGCFKSGCTGHVVITNVVEVNNQI